DPLRSAQPARNASREGRARGCAMAVKRLRQVYIAAGDVDSVSDFLARVLGLEEQFRDGDRWAQFRAGDVSLAVAGESEWRGAARGSAVPVFEVDDLAAMVEAATAAGATVGE